MNRIYKKSPIVLLIVILFVSYVFIALMGYYFKNPPEYKYFIPKDFITPLPKEQYKFKQAQRVNRLPQFDEWFEIRSLMLNVVCSFNYIEYEYLGYYFITSYCPSECGYNGSNYPTGWTTSTGTICHYSDVWSEPTTCAIDPSVRKYGDYLCIGDPYSSDVNAKKIYHAEDCGPGVKGKWIDCFVETFAEVQAWPTGYKPVYLVTFKTKKIEEKGWFFKYEHFNSDLFRSSNSDWYVFGSDT